MKDSGGTPIQAGLVLHQGFVPDKTLRESNT
jgi:hypothetical protein